MSCKTFTVDHHGRLPALNISAPTALIYLTRPSLAFSTAKQRSLRPHMGENRGLVQSRLVSVAWCSKSKRQETPSEAATSRVHIVGAGAAFLAADRIPPTSNKSLAKRNHRHSRYSASFRRQQRALGGVMQILKNKKEVARHAKAQRAPNPQAQSSNGLSDAEQFLSAHYKRQPIVFTMAAARKCMDSNPAKYIFESIGGIACQRFRQAHPRIVKKPAAREARRPPSNLAISIHNAIRVRLARKSPNIGMQPQFFITNSGAEAGRRRAKLARLCSPHPLTRR